MDLSVFEEATREWQGAGGPPQWKAAWERARVLLGPRWEDGRFRNDQYRNTKDPADSAAGLAADGAAGLATALYIVARERGIPVSEVSRADITEFTRQEREHVSVVMRRWESRLGALGHNTDVPDPADPVAARWQFLKYDHPEPWHLEDFSMTRQGPAVLDSLEYVLSSQVDLSFEG